MDDDRKKLLRRLSTLATELMEDAHEAAIVSIPAAGPGALSLLKTSYRTESLVFPPNAG